MFSVPKLALAFALASAFAIAGCGGSGATIGSGGTIPLGGSGTSGSPTPKATTSGAPTGTTTTAPTPSATPSGSAQQSTFAAPTAPPYDATSPTTTVPAVPASGCRAGQTYSVYVDSAPTDISAGGSLEAFTVFEPTQICAAQSYPLIFNGSGFGSARTSTAGSFASFNNAGFGVISVDQAGEGNDGGKIRVMDPDQEGIMLLAAMNWAQAKLSWLAYGPTNDGSDPHEPIYGSDGGSYGGMYQFMLLNVDKRHRLRAMAPQITPADLNFSLFQGGAIKTLWDTFLFGDGQTAGNGTSRAQFDPYVNNGFVQDFAANAEDTGFHDFFGYHSADYFCNGASIATNGNSLFDGNAPALPPTTAPPKINALIYIGIRDTLFNFTNGYNNYKCLQRGGGDVRLLSYQYGHNSLQVVPDPYSYLFYGPENDLDENCGKVAQATAELAWFNQYLKGQSGAVAAAGVPTTPCISLGMGDGITVPNISTSTSGTAQKSFAVSTTVVAGITPDAGETAAPNVTNLYTAGASGDVVAGIPHVTIDVAPVAASLNAPTIYVGLGVLHVSNPAIYELMDNEVTPIVGAGHFDVDLVGGGIRLQPGDQLALLTFGFSNQYAATGTVHPTMPVPQAVTVTGTVSIPDLGPMPSDI